MTNPFHRFQQWRKERYYREQYQWLTFDFLAWLQICNNVGTLISPRDMALESTRSHFNDPTFVPRSKK